MPEESDSIIEFNELESFSYLFKEMCDPSPIPVTNKNTKSSRIKFRIVDTLLFKEGHPFRWIFTSSKTGIIITL